MTTEKQLIANQQNAQLSTGPTTNSGKMIVSSNAIKHGIFTKDLIVSSEIGEENQREYQEVLDNLIDSLSPCNQIESLLVEKIAVDFWRLRRVIRFETGGIAEHISDLLNQFYSYGTKNNRTIDQEILHMEELIERNTLYIESLSRREVSFDQPIWRNDDLEADIIDDLYIVAKSIEKLTQADKKILYNPPCLPLTDLQSLLQKYDYDDPNKISSTLIELYMKENKKLKEEIQKLSTQKLSNAEADKLNFMLGMVPASEHVDKILKYERSLQKSIFQNLLMLKKLQGSF